MASQETKTQQIPQVAPQPEVVAPAVQEHSDYRPTNGYNPLIKLKRSIMYWFSPENMMKDKYLMKHLTPKLVVPLEVIMNYPSIQESKTPRETVIGIISDISYLDYLKDTDEIKINAQPEFIMSLVVRTEATLQNIPEDMTLDELDSITQKWSPSPVLRYLQMDDHSVKLLFKENLKDVLDLLNRSTIREEPVVFRLKLRTEEEIAEWLAQIKRTVNVQSAQLSAGSPQSADPKHETKPVRPPKKAKKDAKRGKSEERKMKAGETTTGATEVVDSNAANTLAHPNDVEQSAAETSGASSQAPKQPRTNNGTAPVSTSNGRGTTPAAQAPTHVSFTTSVNGRNHERFPQLKATDSKSLLTESGYSVSPIVYQLSEICQIATALAQASETPKFAVDTSSCPVIREDLKPRELIVTHAQTAAQRSAATIWNRGIPWNRRAAHTGAVLPTINNGAPTILLPGIPTPQKPATQPATGSATTKGSQRGSGNNGSRRNNRNRSNANNAASGAAGATTPHTDGPKRGRKARKENAGANGSGQNKKKTETGSSPVAVTAKSH